MCEKNAPLVASLSRPVRTSRPAAPTSGDLNSCAVFSAENGKRLKTISGEALAYFLGYDWPGNVRELRNMVERLVIMTTGDVYARAPHAGRGGWSWYTGSAGWMYRAGLESILGLRRRGSTFMIDPCIPSSWPQYSIDWRYLDTRYTITVSNPDRVCRGVASSELDGKPVDARAIPLVDDGGTHVIRIVLGQHRR